MKTLRLYQNAAVQVIISDELDYALIYPTGSGKTIIMVAIASILLKEGWRIIIASPQQQIEENFTKRDYTRIRRQGEDILSVPHELTTAARENDDGIVDTIRAYLEAEEHPGYALVCTHNALTRVRPPTGVPDDMSRVIIMVDECHHVSAIGLSQFVEAASRAGARLIYASATDFRSDDSEVVRPGMQVLRRTLPQHMADGDAPKNFKSNVHAIRLPGYDVSAAQFHGQEPPSREFQAEIIRQMVKRWLADGKPKVIVRIPVMPGGSSEMVERVTAAFQRRRARVLDVSGNTQEDRDRFLHRLAEERALTNYENSKYDVVVGVQRVVEGMDWKWCSTVYCAGIPRSIHTVSQLIGRASRKKSGRERYPESHRELMQAEWFVPCANWETFNGLPQYHAQSVLLVCAFLHNLENSRDWWAVQTMHRGIVASLGHTPITEGFIERYPYIDPEFGAIVTTALNAASTDLARTGVSVTYGSLFHWVLTHRPDVPRAVLAQQLVQYMARDQNISLAQARARFYAELGEALTEGRSIRMAILRAFMSVLDELQAECNLADLEQNMSRLKEQFLELTGREMIEFAQRLIARRPLTPEWLTEVCRAYHSRTGVFPSNDEAGGPDGWPSERWAMINAAIANRTRDWPLSGIRSLEQFCQVYLCGRAVGTVREVIRTAATELGILGHAVHRKMLHSFLDKMVTFNGLETAVPIGSLPAFPGLRGQESYPDVLGLLHAWFAAIWNRAEEPITIIHAWLICERLQGWLMQHRRGDLGQIPTRDRAEFTRIWAGTELAFEVRTEAPRLQDLSRFLSAAPSGNLLAPGRTYYCNLTRCPFSSVRSASEVLVVREGQSLVELPQTVPVELYLVRSEQRGYKAASLSEFSVAALRDAMNRPRLPTLGLLVPLTWFTHCLYSAEGGRRPTEIAERLDPLGTLRRLPDVLCVG